MENYLSFYYDIKVIKLEEFDNYFKVFTDTDTYLFSEIHDNNLVINVIDYLNKTNFLYYLLVYTNKNDLFVNIEDKNYALFKVREVESDINVLLFPSFSASGKCNWGDVWSKRVDYYLEQIKEIVDRVEIKYIMDYYLSLAEMAISYYNNLQEIYSENELVYSLGHYVVDFDINKDNYYNPANMCIDLNVRDVAEYIKFAFFEDIKTNKEIIDLVDKLVLNDAMANYFLDRLIYPSYFFRLFDNYLIKGQVTKKVDLYIKKNRDYESLISVIYSKLSIRYDIRAYMYMFKSQY